MKKLFLISLLLCGCTTPEGRLLQWQQELPPNSTEIKELSKSWVTFKWHNKKYLYGWNGSGDISRTVMVELHEE